MNFAMAVAQVRKSPLTFLSSENARALGAFFSGYRWVDESAGPILDHLTREFDGPDQADACSRACLASADSRMAFRHVLDRLEQVLMRMGTPSPSSGPRANLSFVASVSDAILQGRPAMVLAEPTVVWMHDYFRGFLVGLSAVRPSESLRQEQRLAAFESWIRSWYGGFRAPWYTIIRVHEGMCEHGLERFLELWAAFEKECPEPALLS